MGGLNSLVIAESDPLTREAVKYAFEREGISVALADSAQSVSSLLKTDVQQLVIVGASAREAAGVDVLHELRAGWTQGNGAVPLLYLGEEPTHEQALAAGATQCLPRPTYARDIVTTARLLANRKRQGGPPTFVGELSDFYGLYYLVRAMAALRWRGVLTLVRGLRRGELRLYMGEVTSAQIGELHGLAALHQLCLWTDARVELRVEDVVRRRQIPLSPADTLTDIERFLCAVRDESGTVSQSAVFEQDASRTEGLPKEVLPVLRLFDGARTVADVIEDSQYRVFETMRVSVRLAELGIIVEMPEQAQGAAIKSTARAALSIEEWLVGGSPVPAPAARSLSEPVGPTPGVPASPPGSKKRKRRKKKKQQAAAAAAAAAVAVSPDNGSRSADWSAVLPSAIHSEPSYAAVVPSVSTGGEISMNRERLEDTTRAAKRAKVFDGGAAAGSETASALASLPAPTERPESLTTQPAPSIAVEQPEPAPAAPVPKLEPDGASQVAQAAQVAQPAARFSEEEEEFFNAGSKIHNQHAAPVETFDDLETEAPKSFWQRLVSRPDSIPRAKSNAEVTPPKKKR